jgi:hypothetical protein
MPIGRILTVWPRLTMKSSNLSGAGGLIAAPWPAPPLRTSFALSSSIPPRTRPPRSHYSPNAAPAITTYQYTLGCVDTIVCRSHIPGCGGKITFEVLCSGGASLPRQSRSFPGAACGPREFASQLHRNDRTGPASAHIASDRRHSPGPTVKSVRAHRQSRRPPTLTWLVLPERLKTIRRHFRVPDGMSNILVPKVMLQGPGVVTLIGELVATGMP